MSSNVPQVLSKQQILDLIQKLKTMRSNGVNNSDPNYKAIVSLLKSQNLQQYTAPPTNVDNSTNPFFNNIPITPPTPSNITPESTFSNNQCNDSESFGMSNNIKNENNNYTSINSMGNTPHQTNIPQPMKVPNSIQSIPSSQQFSKDSRGNISNSFISNQNHGNNNQSNFNPNNFNNNQNTNNSPILQPIGSTRPPSIPNHNNNNNNRIGQSVFIPSQILQLKAQISVFKCIMNNTPISRDQLEQCRKKMVSNPHSNDHIIISTRNKTENMPNVPINPPYEQNPSFKVSTRTTNSGNSNNNNMVSDKKFNIQQNTPLRNTFPEIDINTLIQDREKRIAFNFELMINNCKNTDIENLSLEKKIQLNQIKLLKIQNKTRYDIVQIIRSSKNTAKKRKPRSRGDKSTYKNQTKLSKEKEFLNSIINHSKNFKDHYHSKSQQLKKINRTMKSYHKKKARREELQREKEAKERMRALRENDEVEYLRLLERVKNDRLTQLLNQTDEYLNQIGLKVREAKDKGSENIIVNTLNKNIGDMTEEEKKKFMKQEGEEAKQLQATKTYYTMAHTIKEDITEQPSILIGGTLKPYQLSGLQWLVSLYNNNLNGVLADEMGLGKTIQTIALITYLIESKGNNGPFLIIVPLSVLANWQSEIAHWAPSLTSIAYKGKAPARKSIYLNQLAHGKFNCAITTYDFIIRDKKYLSKVHWNYIIIDEGHRIKNANSKLTVTLSTTYKSKYRLLLTGTPLQNSLPELWSLLNFLLPTIFNSVENFQNWFSEPFVGEKTELNEEETALIIHRLHKVLRPFLLRRLKQEVEDQLPDKVEKVLRCNYSAMQQKLYNNMEKYGVLLCGKSSRSLNNTLMELRKVCNHPYLCNNNADYYLNEDLIRCSGKFVLLDGLLRKLKASGHRVLIFSQMTEVMTILGDMLTFRGYNFLRLDGSTTPEERGILPDKFNASDSPYFIFMLSTRAGGQGLNLQAADTVVIFDSDWNPQMDLQAQDRAHRIGQKNEVRVFRLITANSVEQKILDKANHKLDVDKKIIQAGMFNNQSSVGQRKEFLMKLLKGNQESDQSFIPSPKQFNRMISRSEEEYELFQKMDIELQEKRKKEWNEKGNSGDPPPLIMQENELPEWLLKEHKPEVKADNRIIYGRGLRQRNEVNYDDGNALKFEELYEEDKEMDENFQTITGKRKRSRSSSTKRKSKKKQKLGHDIDNLTTKLLKVYKKVRYCKDDYQRERSFLFQKLPSSKQYPDYYKIIKNPIDLKTIKKRIVSEYYGSVKEFKDDMDLLFQNACTYNVEGSQVYYDSLMMKKECENAIRKIKKSDEEFKIDDNE